MSDLKSPGEQFADTAEWKDLVAEVEAVNRRCKAFAAALGLTDDHLEALLVGYDLRIVGRQLRRS